MPRSAVLAGATGLVGSHVLNYLLKEPAYSRITVLVRRALNVTHPALHVREIEFDQIHLQQFDPGADVYCALGTTIRKAGSQQAFRKIDLEYPLALAKQALACGARSFLAVSSVGVNPATSNFYLKTKAEMEQAIGALPFEAVHIFRPSILVGERQESRPAEKLGIVVAKAISFSLIGSLRKYRPIEAETVASAMVRTATHDARRGVHIHHYDEMAK